MYLDMGFHIIFYDLRGHGENEPDFCTFSIRESKDLDCLIQDTRQRFSDIQVLGLHGESLGGATTIAVLKYHPAIDFAVDDCGFSEIIPIMQAGLKNMHIPGSLVHLASLCAKIRYGYFFREMRPIDSLQGNQVPLLFMHGEADSFIPCSHSVQMQKADPGYSEIHLIPEAEHARSILTAPEEYRKAVRNFLEKHGKSL